jgi:hypothetical protein
LNEDFIKTFINNIDWIQFKIVTENYTIDDRLDTIHNMFLSYAQEKEYETRRHYYDLKAKVNDNTIKFFNNKIKDFSIHIMNHKEVWAWVLAVGLLYKFGTWEITVETIKHRIEVSDIDPNMTLLDNIIRIYPHLRSLVENNAASLTQNVDDHIITTGAWEYFLECDTWKEIATKQNEIIIVFGVGIVVIIIKCWISR